MRHRSASCLSTTASTAALRASTSRAPRSSPTTVTGSQVNFGFVNLSASNCSIQKSSSWSGVLGATRSLTGIAEAGATHSSPEKSASAFGASSSTSSPPRGAAAISSASSAAAMASSVSAWMRSVAGRSRPTRSERARRSSVPASESTPSESSGAAVSSSSTPRTRCATLTTNDFIDVLAGPLRDFFRGAGAATTSSSSCKSVTLTWFFSTSDVFLCARNDDAVCELTAEQTASCAAASRRRKSSTTRVSVPGRSCGTGPPDVATMRTRRAAWP
mmetsp:Transcript_12549/g.41903  ORF Transcript_12549/g.41903 Transcript_12549/m.41903 type:complete len:274 (-) Transcript_12549:225-1046(-)